jgi:hypothetical protein
VAPSRRSRRLLVFAGLALLPVAAACNALVGLDDYDKVACTGGRCDGGVTTDGPSEADRPDIVLVEAGGAGPVSWARFKMPNYPYDAGPDAKVDNPMTYDASPGGYVDAVTKLVWQEPIPTGQQGRKTFADARRACTDGWRLPTRIELITLLDMSTPGARTASVFASTEKVEYWTSSEVRPYAQQGGQRWTVNFRPGSVEVLTPFGESEQAAVRCVKDVQ